VFQPVKVSGQNKIKGLHQPLVTQTLFDDVQDALTGKTSAPVVHKKVNPEFPLKGFVMCSECGKKLTAGFVKGRKEKYPRYWCWNTKCAVRYSSARSWHLACIQRVYATAPKPIILNRTTPC
jgi:hypothetical protein